MKIDENRLNDGSRGEALKEWQAPEIVSVIPVSETRGNGGAGFDFASEVS
jgi:NADH:ubiquinone oxidoreductase subunit F (NADH-binding)